MQISKERLNKIIKEEIISALKEGMPQSLGHMEEEETPDLFQLAQDLRKVADRFDPGVATVLKRAAEILHMESGVFE